MTKLKDKSSGSCRKKAEQADSAEKESKEPEVPETNSSPVCYADSPDVRPEYRLENQHPPAERKSLLNME